jgi:hypothetical protein
MTMWALPSFILKHLFKTLIMSYNSSGDTLSITYLSGELMCSIVGFMVVSVGAVGGRSCFHYHFFMHPSLSGRGMGA